MSISCLRHYQGRLKLFFFGGVTYITCCYTLTLPLSEGLHLLFCVLYNVVLENHSVQNFPWGGGGGSIASSRPSSYLIVFLLLFLCFWVCLFVCALLRGAMDWSVFMA